MGSFRPFKRTLKNKLYVSLFAFFDSIAQWFINHADLDKPIILPTKKPIALEPFPKVIRVGLKPKTHFEKKLWHQRRENCDS